MVSKDLKDDENFMEDEDIEGIEPDEMAVSEDVELIDYDEDEELIITDDLAEIEEEVYDSPSVLFMGTSKPKTDEEWHELLLNASSENVPQYSIKDSYKEGDLILHPIFGLGVVSKVRTPKKMEVIFTNEEKAIVKKLMAMNIQN